MNVTFDINSEWECSRAIIQLKRLMKLYEDKT